MSQEKEKRVQFSLPNLNKFVKFLLKEQSRKLVKIWEPRKAVSAQDGRMGTCGACILDDILKNCLCSRTVMGMSAVRKKQFVVFNLCKYFSFSNEWLSKLLCKNLIDLNVLFLSLIFLCQGICIKLSLTQFVFHVCQLSYIHLSFYCLSPFPLCYIRGTPIFGQHWPNVLPSGQNQTTESIRS